MTKQRNLRTMTGLIRKQKAFKLPSKTLQSHKSECDINFIIGKFNTTGQLPFNTRSNPRFEDVSDLSDYQQSLNTVIAAEEAFMSLSSDIRKRFNNDPGQYMEFCMNPNNSDELEKLGLSNPKKPKSTTSVEPNPSADPPAVAKSKPEDSK